jgi:hypothetical protein
MTSQETALEEIRGRLVRLEKQNRRVKQHGVAALIVAASLFLMGQAPSKKTIEANEFILRDASGNVRAKLAMRADLSTPEMLLFDDKGNVSIQLIGGCGGNRAKLPGGVKTPKRLGGRVSVYNGQDQLAGSFGADTEVGASLLTQNSDGSPNGLLQGGSLHLLDPKGHERTYLDPGSVEVQDFDQNGRTSTNLKPGSVAVKDSQGFQATLGTQELVTPRTGETHKTSAASLVLFDKDQNVIWKAP